LFPSKFFYKLNSNVLEFIVENDVYYPEEDSIFFADTIIEYLSNYFSKSKEDKRKIKKILEVGCGCGFLSIIIYKFFEKNLGKDVKRMKFVAIDINRKAVENTRINAKKHKAKILVKFSDLFENIKEKFDLIIFNTPYLPVEEDYSYSIFQKGENTIDKFLKNVKNFMNYNAVILFLVSSITPIKIPNSYIARIIKRKRIDWEELRVYEIKLRF
ncbi:MAG: methyltransferase domain-containing protein, partial [Candidatus Aenigmatarchaeota archaeon]